MKRKKFSIIILSAALVLALFFKLFKSARADSPLTIWWPANNASMIGHQPFKALIDGKNIADYQMYWQVDGGSLNQMSDNYTDYPHKEYDVDLTNWTWHGNGPYTVNFVAKDSNGNFLNQASVVINVPQNTLQTTTPSSTPSPIPTPSSTPTPTPIPTTVANISGLYVDPGNINVTKNLYLQQKIESQPQAKWFGNWNSDIAGDVKTFTSKALLANKIPVLVSYNIPLRDCGGYSSGGSNDFNTYRNWINAFSSGIVGNPIVILEPDSLAQLDCLSPTDQNARLSLLSFAVSALKNHGAKVYLDAGHPGWQTPNVIASRLNTAGITQANGFSLNVSNFINTTDNINYGKQISNLLGGKHFVIDTGRNGNGPTADYAWCNPPGRALGEKPMLLNNQGPLDAYLWIKRPGESDGTCNGGPTAGTFWEDYALGLSQRAAW